MHACMYVYVLACIHTYIYTYIHTRTHTHTHTHTHARARAHTNKQTDKHTQTHINTVSLYYILPSSRAVLFSKRQSSSVRLPRCTRMAPPLPTNEIRPLQQSECTRTSSPFTWNESSYRRSFAGRKLPAALCSNVQFVTNDCVCGCVR